MEKRTVFAKLAAALMVVAVALTSVFYVPAQAAESKVYTVTGQYHQTEARSMLKKVNKFRTGKNAWYYAEDGSKYKCKGLKKYTYDYTLEQIAMERAMEVSVLFDHTRPNGESCFTAYPDNTYYMCGENIAMGYKLSAGDAFKLWQEKNYGYSGQGHRRSMLSEGFSCIGIACFEVDGYTYWVQEFAYPNSGAKKTKANNKTKTKKIECITQ